MWIAHRSRTDRILAAIELPALGVWVGALVGFAFISAPIAFRIVGAADLERFAALTSGTLAALAILGYVCGAIAAVVAVVRSIEASDRIYDLLRVALVALAEVLIVLHGRLIVPAMAQIADVRSPAYHALHTRSTLFYGGALLLVFAAIVMAAARPEN